MWRLIITIFALISFNTQAFCFERAGEYYNINPQLLQAIATVESGLNPRAINPDEQSLGLMQIHPQWFSRLTQFKISPATLLADPCTNVNVGAWILAGNFSTHGKNWNSIGAYNAGFSTRKKVQHNRDIYINKIKQALTKIQNSQKPHRQ